MSGFIYLVEDERSIITLLKYNLEKEGYKFEFSDSGEEALKSIRKKKSRSGIVRLDVTRSFWN